MTPPSGYAPVDEFNISPTTPLFITVPNILVHDDNFVQVIIKDLGF